MAKKAPKDPTFVDIIHEWLGQQGLRKRWGIEQIGVGEPDWIPQGKIFLRENDVPYFTIWGKRVFDQGDNSRFADVRDPEFFTQLRKMLDEREASVTIICRCPQCEGVKL